MSLLARIARKIAHRFRPKGVVRKMINAPGRNFQGVTAIDLWERQYRFKETKAARSGTMRRLAREKKRRVAN